MDFLGYPSMRSAPGAAPAAGGEGAPMRANHGVLADPTSATAVSHPGCSASARRLLRQFIDGSGYAMLIETGAGVVLLANRAAEKLLKRSEAQLRAAPVARHGENSSRTDSAVDPEFGVDAQSTMLELDGSVLRLVTLLDRSSGSGRCANVDALLRSSRAREEHLSHLASHDPLTGLLNRRGLALELACENRRSRRSGASLAAILLDCDDFKRVNELLGHSGGDRALCELARRLEGGLRPTDRLGRIGGDEFLVLLPETRLAEASAVAERLRAAVSTVQFASASTVVRLTASLGVEAVLEDSPSLDFIVALAEESLARSKSAGKNRASALGAPALSVARALVLRLRTATDVPVAEHKIVRLADARIVGAKLELGDREDRIESASDPLRAIGDEQLLEQLDIERLRRCLAGASEHASEWELHVELLPSTLLRTKPTDLVAALTRAHPACRVCIEVSEQQVVGDPAALLPALGALRAAGVRLALTQTSFARGALEALIVLEPDAVKLQAHFAAIAQSDAGRERSLSRLARVVRALGCELHAVGVASTSQIAFWQAVGATHGQGPLWDCALPAFPLQPEGCRRSPQTSNATTT